MGGGSVPGEFEHLVLLALAGFDGEATGRQVYESLTEATGRDVSIAAVHITLARLDQKDWALSRTSPPQAGRGGRPRKHYSLTAAGATLLSELRRQRERLWDVARDHPLLEER